MTHVNGNAMLVAEDDTQKGDLILVGKIPVYVALENANKDQLLAAAILGNYIGTVEVRATEDVKYGQPIGVNGHTVGIALADAKPGELFELAHRVAV